MKTTPREKVQALYTGGRGRHSFAGDVGLHLANPTAVIVSTPDVFAMGRPIARGADISLIHNLRHVFKRSEQDTWYIYAYSGKVSSCLQFFPYPLTHIAYERGDRCGLRFYPFNRFSKRCAHISLTEGR